MIRGVVDTNVLVSPAIKQRGAEAAALDLVAEGELVLCVSEPILKKLALCPDCGFSQTARHVAVAKLRNLVEGARLVRSGLS